MAQKFRGRFIEAGYPWRIRIQFDASHNFAELSTFVAHVKADADDEAIITTATVTWINTTTLDVDIPETSGAAWPVGKTVVFDIIRTDGAAKEHLGIRVEVPVRNPVTRL